MKRLHVQLQPERMLGFDALQVGRDLQTLAEESGLAKSVEIVEGNDQGPYVGIDFASDNVQGLWFRLLDRLLANSALTECSIVCCEGDNGWDDYLLLHHFDPA